MIDRLALPLFVVALFAAWCFRPRPEWVFSIDGRVVGIEPFRSLSVVLPYVPPGPPLHHLKAQTRGMPTSVTYSTSVEFSGQLCKGEGEGEGEGEKTAKLDWAQWVLRAPTNVWLVGPSRRALLFDGCRLGFRWGRQ